MAGQQCLVMFHKVLNLAGLQNRSAQAETMSSRYRLWRFVVVVCLMDSFSICVCVCVFVMSVHVSAFVMSVCACACMHACVHAWVCMSLCRFVSGGQNALFNVMCQNPCYYD